MWVNILTRHSDAEFAAIELPFPKAWALDTAPFILVQINNGADHYPNSNER